MMGKSSKAFFGISLASIMVLGGFSFTNNLIPEADAYVYKQSRNFSNEYDYYVYATEFVDPGYYVNNTMSCNDDDDVVGSQIYAPYISSSAYVYTSPGLYPVSQNSDGHNVFTEIARNIIYNDYNTRTYVFTYAFCNYR